MLTIISSYLPDFEICKQRDALVVFEDNDSYIHKVVEVGRVPAGKFETMDDKELLAQCKDYDYSGELFDGSAYCFWKLDMGV